MHHLLPFVDWNHSDVDRLAPMHEDRIPEEGLMHGRWAIAWREGPHP